MRALPLSIFFALTCITFVAHSADKQSPDPSASSQVIGIDTEHARQVRKPLVEDKTLSTAAQNVQIDVKNGIAHLRGVVKSELERKEVEVRANSVMGDGKVMSHLEIKPE